MRLPHNWLAHRTCAAVLSAALVVCGAAAPAIADELSDATVLTTQDAKTTPEIDESVDEGLESEATLSPSVTYRTHVQSTGWQGWKADGEEAGTDGQSKRLEGIEINVAGIGEGSITYRTHVQTYGWEQTWRTAGQMSGTEGESKRLEAIQIKLTGKAEELFDVWYRVHAQTYGWLGWAKNGETAGTASLSKRLEAIEIKVLAKDSEAPGTTNQPCVNPSVLYQCHVQKTGWQEWMFDGDIAGTVGQSKRLEGIALKLGGDFAESSIQYRTHVQTYGWEEEWRTNGTVSGTEGQSKRLEAIQIQLSGDADAKYDVFYRVHAQQYGWLGWAKNGESAGTAGYSYRLEGIQVVLLEKGSEAPSAKTMPNYIASAREEAFIEKAEA